MSNGLPHISEHVQQQSIWTKMVFMNNNVICFPSHGFEPLQFVKIKLSSPLLIYGIKKEKFKIYASWQIYY